MLQSIAAKSSVYQTIANFREAILANAQNATKTASPQRNPKESVGLSGSCRVHVDAVVYLSRTDFSATGLEH